MTKTSQAQLTSDDEGAPSQEPPPNPDFNLEGISQGKNEFEDVFSFGFGFENGNES